jgi:hypothetical protein
MYRLHVGWLRLNVGMSVMTMYGCLMTMSTSVPRPFPSHFLHTRPLEQPTRRFLEND